jgi:hypothetical protein
MLDVLKFLAHLPQGGQSLPLQRSSMNFAFFAHFLFWTGR